jgi:hypothetical protein
LDTQEMPVSSWRLDLTIIAHDIDHSLQIRRHGLFGNVPRSGLPGSRHGLLRNNSLLADGAAIIEASKLAEAMSVDGMTAWQILETDETENMSSRQTGQLFLYLSLKQL